MLKYDQWLNWKLVRLANGRTTKIPYNVKAHRNANAHDGKAVYNKVTAFNSPDYSPGFVITDDDSFFVIDIDHVRNEDGGFNEFTTEMMTIFKDCYIEVSVSGNGVHIIGSITNKDVSHKCKNLEHDAELYTRKRFVTISKSHAQDNLINNSLTVVDDEFEMIVGKYFKRDVSYDTDSEEWRNTSVDEWHGPEDDDELIAKMLKSSSGASTFDDTKASIKDLWTRNVNSLSKAFPHERLEFDSSSADQALLSHLAFWTGKNHSRMERLFNLSALVRDKWVEREDYRRMSIINACCMTQNVHGQGVSIDQVVEAKKIAEDNSDSDNLGEVSTRGIGFQLMTPEGQMVYFNDCVYVSDENKIIIPNGRLLSKSQFDAFYGGWIFSMDAENNKTTKSAWDVFTTSQAVNFNKVNGRIFKPSDSKRFHIDSEGVTYINTYTPQNIPSVPGDVSKFTNHICKLIPDERDRDILLSWCAAVVQYPGVKFGWSPLIQGTYGNGKSMIGECICNAVGRKYSHVPEASEITEKFNDWLLNTVFQCVDEMYTGKDKYKTIEKFKTWIQHRGNIEIRAMQTGKVMHEICCNFLLLTNHKDAIVKTREDRRFAVFYSKQQTIEDMEEDGLLDDYFTDLFGWLNGTGEYEGKTPGYHNVTHFLQTYKIPDELNPSGRCTRAPKTTSTEEAITESLSNPEQLVKSVIDEQQIGFSDGIVSLTQVRRLLKEFNMKFPFNKIKDMMRTLGYSQHPQLPNGRSTKYVDFDEGRPILYVTPEVIEKTKGWQPGRIVNLYLEALNMRTGSPEELLNAKDGGECFR